MFCGTGGSVGGGGATAIFVVMMKVEPSERWIELPEAWDTEASRAPGKYACEDPNNNWIVIPDCVTEEPASFWSVIMAPMFCSWDAIIGLLRCRCMRGTESIRSGTRRRFLEVLHSRYDLVGRSYRESLWEALDF